MTHWDAEDFERRWRAAQRIHEHAKQVRSRPTAAQGEDADPSCAEEAPCIPSDSDSLSTVDSPSLDSLWWEYSRAPRTPRTTPRTTPSSGHTRAAWLKMLWRFVKRGRG